MPPAAILDVDGTLVDTNYHHSIAWYRAFRQHDVVLPIWRIHRHIGMGGDQLVNRAAESVLYSELITEVEPLEGARSTRASSPTAGPRPPTWRRPSLSRTSWLPPWRRPAAATR